MYFQGESLAALWLTVDAMDFDRQIIEELRAAAAEDNPTPDKILYPKNDEI